MSTGRRAYDLMRGYVNREWERIQDVYESAAQQELNDALENPVKPSSSAPSTGTPVQEVVLLTQEEKARQILGVSVSASFDEIKAAFDRLNERSDPSKFPEGSPEAGQATEIRSRVYKAYRILAEQFDPTEARFKSLEIE